MSALAVYSGECLLCEVGLKVPFKDVCGKALHTGDVVVIYPDDGHPDFSMTVVIQDGDGSWVMGIKSIDLVDEPGYWRVQKVKDHLDVVAGEHWRAWGFNFRPSASAIETGTAETEGLGPEAESATHEVGDAK